jgi:hypothetical protein
MLEMLPAEPQGPWRQNGEFLEAVFTVAARLLLKWMEVGVPQPGLPFDVDAFFQEVRKETTYVPTNPGPTSFPLSGGVRPES